ncbi:exosortase F system-associated protein [Oscillatoria amoena NRMC-F 0135]|nr:exosortase F system-associated protein [Oscillatoria amoena NRMC-F 0135]
MFNSTGVRIGLFLLALMGLLGVFLFQRYDLAACIGVGEPVWKFITNRTIRFIVNDVFMIVLLYALFPERKYVIFAIWVQVVGLVFILLPYFVIKFNFPYYNGPLISFLHRLVLNPLLMILLIPAFYVQRSLQKSSH